MLNSGSSAIGEIRRNDREDGARLAAAVHRPGRGRQHSVPAAVFARLTADGNMHLKNLAVLKTAEAGAKTFTTVRFAPLYDAVTTRVFPGLGGDRMALKLNGKDDRLTRQDFLALARTIGLTVEDAEAGLDALTTRIPERLMTLQLPAFASEFGGARAVRDKVEAIAAARCAALGTAGGEFVSVAEGLALIGRDRAGSDA